MKLKKVPQRMCVACREMKPKNELIRIVKNNEGVVAADLTGKSNGRGAYICRDIECMEKARKQKGLERALETKISAEIYDAIKVQMEEK